MTAIAFFNLNNRPPWPNPSTLLSVSHTVLTSATATAARINPDKQAPQTLEDVEASAAVHDAFQIPSSPYQRHAYDVRTGAAGSSESAEFVRLSDEQVVRSRDREARSGRSRRRS
ncbi:hypothetical protein HWV62_4677 [Athelia sp. TMB]|nr:hypothetical protein HWV62_4677 [Athelia sp. TMB]